MSLKKFTKVAPIENGASFEENALIKARFASKLISHSFATLADDSGICVDSLNGQPGVFSARWANKNNYQNAFQKIKNSLAEKGLDINEQCAKFICVLVLIDRKKNEYIFTGSLKGKLTLPPRGKNGFGYDPIFIPLNQKKTLAQISPSLKSSFSHRKKAWDKLLNHSIFKKYFTYGNFVIF